MFWLDCCHFHFAIFTVTTANIIRFTAKHLRYIHTYVRDQYIYDKPYITGSYTKKVQQK